VRLRHLVIRTLWVIIFAMVLYGLMLFFFRHELERISHWLSEHLGYGGVFLYTLVVDTLIIPATVDFLWPVVQDWNAPLVLFVMSLGSVLGGFFGYLIGRYLNHFSFVHRLTSSYRQHGQALIEKYGVWAVVLASLTPIPYSTVSWIAGMLKLSRRLYLIGALFRIPRLILYFYLFRSGIILFNFFQGT